jgi:hypothetical protein
MTSVGREGYAKVTLRNSMEPVSEATGGRAPASDDESMPGTRSIISKSLKAAGEGRRGMCMQTPKVMRQRFNAPAVCAAANAAKFGPTCPSAKAPMSTAMRVCTTVRGRGVAGSFVEPSRKCITAPCLPLEPVKQPEIVGSKRHAGCASRDCTMSTPATMLAKPYRMKMVPN